MFKKLAKKIIYAIAAKDEKQILDAVSDSEIVSFDVFDTLLKRDVLEPQDVFGLIEKEIETHEGLKCKGFSVLRVEAEHRARQAHPERDVTLEEIYAYFPTDSSGRKKLMQMECLMELSVSTPNIPMKRVYDACIRQGKKIFFISDMYLSEDNIRALLEKNGYTRGKLYVSSESGFTKRSGKLFKYVRQQEHIANERWIHIGDSIGSDYLMPRKSGLKSAVISERLSHNPYVDRKIFRNNADYRRLNHFIDIRIERYDDPYKKIGYAVLGPLLYGFSKWLERSILEDEMIVFLAREGLVMKRAFDIVSNRQSVYFYISRNSVRNPYMKCLNSPEEAPAEFSRLHMRSQKETARTYGLSEEKIKEIFKNKGLDEKRLVTNIELKTDLLKSIWPDIQEKAREQYDLLQQYITQLGIDNRCALVDIGWHGTMQGLLSGCRFGCKGREIIWDGYYLGIYNESINSMSEGSDRKSFLFEKNRNKRIHDGIKYSCAFIEMLFSANHGTTRSYKKSTERIEPVLGEMDNSIATMRKLAFLQEAAIEFVDDMNKSPLGNAISIDPYVFAGNYLCLASVPTFQTINLFRDFDFEDGKITRLTSDYGLCYYFRHIRQFKFDFMGSQCKAWFLKSIFKIPLPYIQILDVIKRLFFEM